MPRALGLMYGGQAIAAAFAAPIGAWLGDLVGWRGVFWALTPIVAANLVWHLAVLPSMPARGGRSFAELWGLLGRPYFRRGLIAIALSWGSAFTMFTYLRPFLEQVSGADAQVLSLLLLALGGSGFVGSSLGGRLASRGGPGLLRLPALVMGAATLALLAFGAWPVAAGLLLAIWGAMNTAMSVIWMSWMSRNVDDLPEAAGGLMVAVIQASILLGGVIGGFLLDLWSVTATFAGSVLLALVALAITGTGRHLLKPNTES